MQGNLFQQALQQAKQDESTPQVWGVINGVVFRTAVDLLPSQKAKKSEGAAELRRQSEQLRKQRAIFRFQQVQQWALVQCSVRGAISQNYW